MTIHYEGWTINTRHAPDGYVTDVTAPDGRIYSSEVVRSTREEAEQDARILIRRVEAEQRQSA